jgi:NB-ARC domain
MPFTPIDLMMKRVENYSNSDSELFTELLYAGEFIVKMTVAAFIASIEDDREHHRYRLLHALVRADGIGEWASSLEEALSGPASQHLAAALTDERRIFSERVRKGSWQHEAVQDLQEVLRGIHPNVQPLGDRASLRSWFTKFAELRNKTRGHGATTPATCAKIARRLHSSVSLLITNNPIFKRPWAYLHRNLSGKYKVVELGGDAAAFAGLKTTSAIRGENYQDGVYMWAGRARRVELVHSDLDASDFFLPNGGFRARTYELHSLITDNRLIGDASPYLLVAGSRPASETEGKGELDVVENVFTNLPAVPTGYVSRPRLEAEIREAITNDRHPIVTLVGQGGIGKTSLTLAILHEITRTERYQVIVWFSARDIDLTVAGPKAVRPRVLAESDIAEEYRSLIGEPTVVQAVSIRAASTMEEHMRGGPLGATLFVFDNFETVRSPVDLFQWIDTNIRLPNKVVITSRFREFRADLPIEVSGMEHEEAEALISQTAIALRIDGLIGAAQREQIIEESNGHPYVIKIILGEIANTGKFGKPSKLIVRKEEILDALFDRTYANLSPMASRIFLTLSGWRSLVPQLAVEAVVRRHGSTGGDPEHAIDELVRMSLVERPRAGDNTDFLGVPLTAALFGSKKLEVSPYRQLIEDDVRFLQDLGATTTAGLREGIRPRMVAFFRKMAKLIGDSNASFQQMRPVLEFVARSYPPAWLLLAELCSEVEGEAGLERSADYVRHFLEDKPPNEEAEAAWQRLISLYRATNNIVGCCSAFLRAGDISKPPLHVISNMANSLNNEREVIERMDVAERAALFKPLARLMEGSLSLASATDLSRLAWLHLHAGDAQRALDIAEFGLQRDPDNLHCQNLVDKLS